MKIYRYSASIPGRYILSMFNNIYLKTHTINYAKIDVGKSANDWKIQIYWRYVFIFITFVSDNYYTLTYRGLAKKQPPLQKYVFGR